MPEPSDPGNPELVRRIRGEVRANGPMPFSRFMELCLYDRDHGYYSSGAGRLGRQGDYYTASDVGRGFGECLARQIEEMDRQLECPDPFDVVELGAGRGLLARDVREAMPGVEGDLAGRLSFTLVDRSPAMRAECRRNVPGAGVVPPDRSAGSRTGCVLAVELFDALPVHRLVRRGSELREIFVDLDDGSHLTEIEAQPGAEAAEIASRYRAAPGDGDEAEVAPGLPALFDRLESAVDRGFLLVVDYGHPAADLYGPHHRRGTLLAYHGHAADGEYLHRIGEQDLTAHVNFTAIEDRAQERGLAFLGRTTQDRFLIANGLIGTFEQPDLETARDPARVKERLQAMQLIHPMGMGRRFHVLVFSKNVEPTPRLRGLDDPFS